MIWGIDTSREKRVKNINLGRVLFKVRANGRNDGSE
jgi:hypothetical protein